MDHLLVWYEREIFGNSKNSLNDVLLTQLRLYNFNNFYCSLGVIYSRVQLLMVNCQTLLYGGTKFYRFWISEGRS